MAANHGVSAANPYQFNSPLPTPPTNDNFAQAKTITSLPFGEWINVNNATIEGNEPTPYCVNAGYSSTIWYAYTPSEKEVLLMGSEGNSPFIAIYTGTSLVELQPEACYNYGSGYEVGLEFKGGVTYYLQLGSAYHSGDDTHFYLEQAPAPTVNFYFFPTMPSKHDAISFSSHVYDQAGFTVQSWLWDLGNGVTSTDGYLSHQYTADGDYTVTHTATTVDGRTNSIEKIVSVRTHDVGIARLSRPRQAKVGQTKRIIVRVANYGYPEDVQVELYKSVPGGFDHIGHLKQLVNVKRNGRTTKFYFSYTFTQQDADIGKVIFKAVASPLTTYDALPADNEFISYAVNVKNRRRGGRSANDALTDELVQSSALDDYSDYSTDTASNVAAILVEAGDGTVTGVIEDITEESIEGNQEESAETFTSYLPLISRQ